MSSSASRYSRTSDAEDSGPVEVALIEVHRASTASSAALMVGKPLTSDRPRSRTNRAPLPARATYLRVGSSGQEPRATGLDQCSPSSETLTRNSLIRPFDESWRGT